jgi:hypothetical protein
MGTWGPGIFSDDEAADARDDWREAVIAGEDLEAATDRILHNARAFDAQPGPDQDSYAANVWIALAVAQFETGRLRDRVGDRALGFLAHGGDLGRWEETTAARRRVLDRWAEKLRGPQPAPKRIRPKRTFAVRFARGDVIRLRDPESGAEGLVYVAALHADGTVPQLEVLAWSGGEVPDAETIAALGPVPDVEEPIYLRRPKIITARRDQAFGPHLGEVVAQGVERPPLEKEMRGTATTWPMLAAGLGRPDHRAGIELALDPDRLAAIQHEIRRQSALSRLDFFERWIGQHEAGKPLFEPQNIVNWVLHVRSNLAEFLTAHEITEFRARGRARPCAGRRDRVAGLGCLQQLAGVAAGCGVAVLGAEHAHELPDDVAALEARDRRPRGLGRGVLDDREVAVGQRGDLR